MTALERRQVPIYFAAVLLGSAVGLLLPQSVSALEMWIWPVVGTLLYFTFLQVPLLQQALTDILVKLCNWFELLKKTTCSDPFFVAHKGRYGSFSRGVF